MLIAEFTSCYHELAITEIKLMSCGCDCSGVFSDKIALIIHEFNAAIAFDPAPANLSFEFHSTFRKALTHRHLSSSGDLAVVHLIFCSIGLPLISLG